MKVTLIGWNGKKNIGDDAMTEVIFAELEKQEVSTILLIGKKSKDAYNYLSKYNISIVYPPFYDFFSSFRGLSGLYHRYFLSVYIAVCSKLIIIGGGTLYHTVGGMKFYNNIARFIKIFKLKRSMLSIGVSVGPFRDNLTAPIFRKFINKIDFISVRDQRSFDYCREFTNKVQLAPDLALSFSKIFRISTAKKDFITVSLRQGHTTGEMLTYIESILRKVDKDFPDVKIKFLTFCELDNKEENDYFISLKFINTLDVKLQQKIEIIRYDNHPIHFFTFLSESKLNICIRLHASIISYSVNSKFLMISYHKKCDDFMNLVNLDHRYLVKDLNSYENIFQILDEIFIKKELSLGTNEEVLRASAKHLDIIKDYGKR